jgi:hypothetical protein
MRRERRELGDIAPVSIADARKAVYLLKKAPDLAE